MLYKLLASELDMNFVLIPKSSACWSNVPVTDRINKNITSVIPRNLCIFHNHFTIIICIMKKRYFHAILL